MGVISADITKTAHDDSTLKLESHHLVHVAGGIPNTPRLHSAPCTLLACRNMAIQRVFAFVTMFACSGEFSPVIREIIFLCPYFSFTPDTQRPSSLRGLRPPIAPNFSQVSPLLFLSSHFVTRLFPMTLALPAVGVLQRTVRPFFFIVSSILNHVCVAKITECAPNQSVGNQQHQY